MHRVMGTWCFVQIDGLLHFITARHVIFSSGSNYKWLELLYNASSNAKKFHSLDLEKWFGEGIFNPLTRNDSVDIMICPIPLLKKDNDVEVIDIQHNNANEWQIIETDDLIYCSYQPWVTEIWKDLRVDPIIRSWMVSRVNKGKWFIYMDGFAFPWNSWSPVFIKPNTWHEHQWKFVWVISANIPYIEKAVSQKTGRVRTIFEDNTWLSIVYTMKYINKMLRSETFQKSLRKFKKHMKK